LAVDYSQLELRILCALSEDLELAKMLKEEDPFERISIEFGRSINSKNNEKGNLKKENNNEIVGIGREKAKQVIKLFLIFEKNLKIRENKNTK